MTRTLALAINRVVTDDNCSGCGGCAVLSTGITMGLDARGYLRPTVAPGSALGADREFRRVCPGVAVRPNPEKGPVHPTMGTYLGVWRAWATDPELRHQGSSGGTLTALSAWLVETEQVNDVVAARSDTDPRRTRTARIVDRADALASSGSRYAPVGNAAVSVSSGEAFIGKPCEASAVRALHASDAHAPLIMSFFCAGTPSQRATDELAAHLSGEQSVVGLWYRGRGWPGEFTVELADGGTNSMNYDESWGKRLGPTTQWRCKICVDGVGESADIVAADLWETDDRGYPTFADADGCSALIARTRRGLDTIRAAQAAGILHLEPIDLDQLAAVQPLQVQRRLTLAGRLLGVLLSGRRTPSYRGFGLLRFAVSDPRTTVRALRGSLRRARAKNASRRNATSKTPNG